MESCLAHASLFFSLKRRRRRRVKNEAHKHNSTRVLSFVHKKSFSAASLKKKVSRDKTKEVKFAFRLQSLFSFFCLFVRRSVFLQIFFSSNFSLIKRCRV